MAIIQQYHKDTDTTYVYESESYWVPELGQSRSRRKCIGKIDPATGEITLVATGYVTITADVAENEDFSGASASYVLRVVPANFKIETFDS